MRAFIPRHCQRKHRTKRMRPAPIKKLNAERRQLASYTGEGMPAPARTLAFDILRRVESGAWASDLLLAHSAGIDSRDAGLASEIVFGTLRYPAQLAFLIEHRSEEHTSELQSPCN